jgi:hypothetical protein
MDQSNMIGQAEGNSRMCKMAGVKDKVALVTGAGSAGGIGFACARAAAGSRREGGGHVDH